MLPGFVKRIGLRSARTFMLDFLDQHEDEFVRLVMIELERFDQRTPDEETYIDIRMAAMGGEIARAILRAVRTFLQEYDPANPKKPIEASGPTPPPAAR